MNAFEQGLERYLSPEQLSRIRSTAVGVAGAGGLGSNCCLMLVRCGFRDIRVVDCDVLEASNLNRQFYFLDQIGRPKVEALRDNLLAVNPDANIQAVHALVDASNVRELFADRQVIVEAFDRADGKRLLAETFLDSGKFLVSASGLAGWGDSDRIRVRAPRPDFRLIGDLSSAAGPDCPPLAPCVTLAAAKQADEVLRHVLGPMPTEKPS